LTTLLISAGGTGGGVYPAVAVAEALQRLDPAPTLHFVGSVGGMEHDLVPRELFIAYHEVHSGPLNGVGIRRAVLGAFKIAVGVVQSWRLIGQIRPAALFITGGWATFPAAVAAWLRRVPMAIYLPDIEPALAIKWLSGLARLILVTTAESKAYFPEGASVVETGYPLRAEVLAATRAAGITQFNLNPDRKTLLVFGGSRGARTINNALSTILPDLLADDKFNLQVIHISGELDWPAVQARRDTLSPPDQARYHAFAYLHGKEMGLALAAADLVVSRAGASTLGEFPHFGLPAILVPYPFAWRYQKVNAAWLVSRGAALQVKDADMPAELLPTIRALLGDPARLDAMRKASAALAHHDPAAEIARQVVGIATESNR
jgi:UDP-N-acetylglucosamine--N-acetylmuramyl-(pentapeptide) pyrophosphoryl-undecaprenol N-acetylglucosamine transferase